MNYVLLQGDCLEQLKELPDNSLDSLVTDPPAGISFMGKEWDDDKGGSKQWIAWMTEVMTECLRVLKPGAHGFVWAIPRTSHWTATALENAGFEIRDVVTHVFGSGFPKSMDVSKAIDKALGIKPLRSEPASGVGFIKADGDWNSCTNRLIMPEATTDLAKEWQGWGTALKPASEHWILVRKPCSEKTVAKNVEKWGTGAINVDASRIKTSDTIGSVKNKDIRSSSLVAQRARLEGSTYQQNTQGRFPANLVLSHQDECEEGQCAEDCAVAEMDRQSGYLNGAGNKATRVAGVGQKSDSVTKAFGAENGPPTVIHDRGGHASRFFYVAKASKKEKNRGCEGLPIKQGGGMAGTINKSLKTGAGNERDASGHNTHPTVKSTKLMRYLITMITPPNGLVLDPFTGSGSTGVAALQNGFSFLGIEKQDEYWAIANARLNDAQIQAGQVESEELDEQEEVNAE